MPETPPENMPQAMNAPGARLGTRLFGAGASAREVGIALGIGAIGAALAAGILYRHGAGWVPVTLGALVAFDLFGGVFVNASVPGKRWYHRPEAARYAPVVFAAFHLHPFVLAVPTNGLSWSSAVTTYVLAVLGVCLITAVPPTLKRPVGMAIAALSVAMATTLAVPDAWAWFPAVFLIKLVAAHAIPPMCPQGART